MMLNNNILSWVSEKNWMTLTLITTVLLLVHSYWTKKPWLKLPPGPPVVPFFGSGPFLVGATIGYGFDIRKGFLNLASYYGDVYTVYLGSRVVVLNGYDVIKEAMVKLGGVFAGRPDIFAFNILSNDGHGIIGTQGRYWKEQRRYVLHVLRNFGLGRNRMQDLILTEASYLMKEFENRVDTVFNPRSHISKAVNNVLTVLAFGQRMDYDDPVMEKNVRVLRDIVVQTGGPKFLNMYPWMRHIPGISRLVGYNAMRQNLDHLQSQYIQWVEDHKGVVCNGETPNDLIGAYLEELQKRLEETNSSFSEKSLTTIISDLFMAGTDTTSTTITWLLLYMVRYPDIQSKVQAEIREAFGADRVILWEDHSKLPYTESFIAEILRYSNVIPLMAPRATMEDVTFHGYHIPRGTMIMMNGYSIDMNPDIWGDPEHFRPERFLDEHGKYQSREEQITFGIGKRVCIGQSLARMEIFLFFTAIMQKFKFRTPPGDSPPRLEGNNGATYQPLPFNVIIEYNNHSC